MFQLAMDEILLNEGVELRLDIQAVTPVVENGRVVGVVTESKSGRECFPAKAVVDASGDADLFDRADIPCVLGKNFLSVVTHWSDTSEKKKALERCFEQPVPAEVYDALAVQLAAAAKEAAADGKKE